MRAGAIRASALLAAAVLAFAPPAGASSALALEKGCLNCHGSPPRGKAPTMAALAQQYAPARDDAAKAQALADHLREHHLFGGVPAHERLSPEEAMRFVAWLIAGGQ